MQPCCRQLGANQERRRRGFLLMQPNELNETWWSVEWHVTDDLSSYLPSLSSHNSYLRYTDISSRFGSMKFYIAMLRKNNLAFHPLLPRASLCISKISFMCSNPFFSRVPYFSSIKGLAVAMKCIFLLLSDQSVWREGNISLLVWKGPPPSDAEAEKLLWGLKN